MLNIQKNGQTDKSSMPSRFRFNTDEHSAIEFMSKSSSAVMINSHIRENAFSHYFEHKNIKVSSNWILIFTLASCLLRNAKNILHVLEKRKDRLYERYHFLN